MRGRRKMSPVRRFVRDMPYGQMFSTRQCLNLGPRRLIDQTLYRLVKKGTLTRLAWGVFIKLKEGMQPPSAKQIAEFKSKGFHRRQCAAGRTAGPDEFTTDAGTTKFLTFSTEEQRIYLKGEAPRKFVLSETAIGKAIRELWQLGRSRVTSVVVHNANARLSPTERLQLQSSCHLMPAWLADIVVWGPQLLQQSAS